MKNIKAKFVCHSCMRAVAMRLDGMELEMMHEEPTCEAFRAANDEDRAEQYLTACGAVTKPLRSKVRA